MLLASVVSSPARADEPRPWAAGVSPDDQAKALALFQEGNAFFTQAQYSQALQRYQLALPHWQHPAIHYNVAVCLINLGQKLEAREHLQAALAYGEAPFESPELFHQAKTYQTLLEGQLAVLTIASDQPGVQISLDGKDLFIAPGEVKQVLLPGKHQVVARRPGYVTMTQEWDVVSGNERRETIKLLSLAEATRYERRWPQWKPWAVLGTGAGVAAIGAGLLWLARSNFTEYDAEIERLCSDGCGPGEIPGTTTDLKNRARFENNLGIAAVAVGGAGAALGVALLILNRERAVLPQEQSAPALNPMVAPGVVGIELQTSF